MRVSTFAEQNRIVHALAVTTSMMLITSLLFAGAYQMPQAHAAAADITDFNGDGFEDLAIGVPGEDIGSIIDAGAVNVIYGIYGSAGGLSATIVPDQIWTQNSPDIEESAAAFDRFGASLAAGDFNNDGYSDLAVGVPGEAVNSNTIAGAGLVNVIYGSASGLSATTVPDQIWHQNSADVEDASESGDRFGDSLAAGDFNNDGRSDLAIGVPAEDIGSIEDAGAVNVIYGSASGLSATTVRADQFWNQNTANVEGTADYSENFGFSLAAGDFNNDLRSDLAIGVPVEDINGKGGAGSANIIYGSASGLSATAVPDQLWHQDSANVEDVSELNDNFGDSLAAGDFNNDGYSDLAVGVPGEAINSNTISAAGAVNVIYGSASGLSATTTVPDQIWNQNSANVEDVSEADDRFGFSLAAGDFNNDGRSDLAIGVYREDVFYLINFGGVNVINAGAVNVIYGSASGLSATTVPDQIWTQNSANVQDVSEANDWFGFSLAAGDFNNDGRSDLAIGVPAEDIGSIIDAGAVNVIYGSASGLSVSATTVPNQIWTQNSANVEDASEAYDNFGNAVN